VFLVGISSHIIMWVLGLVVSRLVHYSWQVATPHRTSALYRVADDDDDNVAVTTIIVSQSYLLPVPWHVADNNGNNVVVVTTTVASCNQDKRSNDRSMGYMRVPLGNISITVAVIELLSQQWVLMLRLSI
jgi:hypothetical protein